MNEFNNRMGAQRAILNVINQNCDFIEELCGLSKKAIERWIQVNRIEPNGHISKVLTEISEKLFFLANKSQEQISEDYKAVSSEVAALTQKLRLVIGGI